MSLRQLLSSEAEAEAVVGAAATRSRYRLG